MLTVYLHDSPDALRIQLTGDLMVPEVGAAQTAWTTGQSTTSERAVVFDLSGVGAIDAAGEDLLKKAAGAGVEFITAGSAAESVVQAISGGVPRILPTPRETAAASLKRWFGCVVPGGQIRKAWQSRVVSPARPQ